MISKNGFLKRRCGLKHKCGFKTRTYGLILLFSIASQYLRADTQESVASGKNQALTQGSSTETRRYFYCTGVPGVNKQRLEVHIDESLKKARVLLAGRQKISAEDQLEISPETTFLTSGKRYETYFYFEPFYLRSDLKTNSLSKFLYLTLRIGELDPQVFSTLTIDHHYRTNTWYCRWLKTNDRFCSSVYHKTEVIKMRCNTGILTTQ